MRARHLLLSLLLMVGLASAAAADAPHMSWDGYLDFGESTRLGYSSSRGLSIRNSATATAPLTFTAAFAGANPGTFHLACPMPGCTCAADICTGTRAPGESATIQVTFTPTATAQVSASIRLTTNDPASPMPSVTIVGRASASVLTLVHPAQGPLEFGGVDMFADSSPVAFTIKNTGNVQMIIYSVTVVGADAGDYSIVSQPAGNLASGAIGSWGIVCHPSQLGARTGRVRIATDAPVAISTTEVDLSCSGGYPELVVAPTAPIAFGPVRIDGPVPVRTVNVANAPGAPAPLSYEAWIEGADPGSYTLACPTFPCSCVAGTCTLHGLPPGEIAQLDVGFAPTLPAGDRHATLTIAANDVTMPFVRVDLSGTAIRPLVALLAPVPAAIHFPDVANGGRSAPQTITLRNTGDAPLQIGAVTGTDPATFDLVGPASATLLPGVQQDWTVTCAPEVRGAHDGRIRLVSDAFNAPAIDVELTCTSVEAELAVTAVQPIASGNDGVIDFGAIGIGGERSTEVTVTNLGNAPAAITALTLAGAPAGFSVGPPGGGLVAPGGSLTFAIDFRPVSAGPSATVLTIDSDANDPVLALRGTGLPVGVQVQPDLVDLGEVRWDLTADQRIMVTNTGQAPLTVTGASLAGPDAGELELVGFAPTVLADGARTQFTVRARPSDALLGPRLATLIVTTDLPAPADVVESAVRFTSVGADLSLDPGAVVDFGDVDLDHASGRTIDLVLTNQGAGPLVVTAIEPLAGVFSKADPASMIAAPHGGRLVIPISFQPTSEGAAEATLRITTTGLYLGGAQAPAVLPIALRGRGVDRHLELADVRFPDTYRDPTDAQVPTATCGADHDRPCAIEVCNSGAAPLRVSMIVDGDDVFALASTAPRVVAPGSPATPSCEAIAVAFRPPAVGTFAGTVTIRDDDDARPMGDIHLAGRGVLRPVEIAPASIEPAHAIVGAPLLLSDLVSGGLVLTSAGGSDTFAVHLRVSGGARVVGDVAPLAPAQSATYDLAFDTSQPGDVTVQVEVFLDDDDEPQATLTIPLTITTDDGGCGCRTSGRASAWPFALALLLLRRRPATGRR